MRNSGKHGLIRTPQRKRCSQTTMTKPSTALDACSSSAAGVLTGPSLRSGQGRLMSGYPGSYELVVVAQMKESSLLDYL